MFISKLKILYSHGRQYIPNLDEVQLSPRFRGRIRIKSTPTDQEAASLKNLCPADAISPANFPGDVSACAPLGVSAAAPSGFPTGADFTRVGAQVATSHVVSEHASDEEFTIDMGRCLFCNECVQRFPHLLEFTPDYHTATTRRTDLLVNERSNSGIHFDAESVRSEIRRTFGHALKLRQVSAGGDNSNEMELNASMNVNFDFSRYGIEFVASPRHADGVVITGPITKNMAIPLELCYNSISDPKVVILCGTDAISGGIFAEEALDRSFLERFPADLYVPGNPVHPLAFIDGVMSLCGRKAPRLKDK